MNFPNGETIENSDHFPVPPRIVKETISFCKENKVHSITEFGAGVGQLLAAALPEILKHDSQFQWNAYDGTGNIEEFMHGYLKWNDLTIPFDAAVSDWVFSFEVAEHVPARFEGMLIRNLHRHNCKGIILSWGALGQGGRQHINNHSAEYVSDIFSKLGYKRDSMWEARFRQREGNSWWFQRNVMVFRRIKSIC